METNTTQYRPYAGGWGHCWFDGREWTAPNDPSNLPGEVFDRLTGGWFDGPHVRRIYPTHEAAMADLQQAMTQGEPFAWEGVQVGDRVRLVEGTAQGDLVVEGVVEKVDLADLSIAVMGRRDYNWYWKRDNKSIELISRPTQPKPNRVEVSASDLVNTTPIDTTVTLLLDDGDTVTGQLINAGRDRLGVWVLLTGCDGQRVYMSDVTTAWVEV